MLFLLSLYTLNRWYEVATFEKTVSNCNVSVENTTLELSPMLKLTSSSHEAKVQNTNKII
jgi:hypothetical protein